ncbi:MAG: carboxypeptidase-like regulatory domain-containing protein, partial [Acidobacteria bacterium]|nr:carboxypeptidase-like regulatory domain-containing protein [Acidobacteriota bacterium]
ERTLGSVGETVTVITDDRGVYRLFGLPAGDFTVGTSWYYHGQPYEVRVPTAAEFKAAFQPATPPAGGAAARPPAQPAPEPPRYNYGPVFAPGVLDPLTADTFPLAPGEVREGIDLRMQFQPMSRIEGTVVNPGGSAASYRLSITRRSPVQALNTISVTGTNADGRFVSGSLSPGPYTVMVETRGSADSLSLWATADVIVGHGEPSVVTLTLQPSVVVTGRLVFAEGGLPLPADLSKVVVSVIPVGPIRSQIETKVDATGAVSISGVIPGSYMLRASVPGPAPAGAAAAWTLSSVTVGTTNVTDRPFDVTPAGVSDLVIGFTDQISELSGSLTTATGAPETDYFIIALPADRMYWTPSSRRIVSTRPDASGRYSFRGLPAGDYRLAVTTDLVPLDLREVSTLEPLAAQSVPVSLSTGQKVTMNLRTPGGAGR